MILVRDIFHLKFGKTKDAKSQLEKTKEFNRKFGFENTRALTDLVTGHSYTLILESEWNSLADWESSVKKGLGAEEWQKWYAGFIPLVESASREILNILE
jgi:hypothetical protein